MKYRIQVKSDDCGWNVISAAFTDRYVAEVMLTHLQSRYPDRDFRIVAFQLVTT